MLVLTLWAQGRGDQRPLPEPAPVRYAAIRVRLAGDAREISLEMPNQSAPAEERDDPPPVRPPRGVHITAMVLSRENFDRWLFADGRSERARQRYLEVLLERRIEVAALVYRLAAPQRAKLQLAGRGDIKRYFDEVQDRRSRFEIDRRNFDAGLAALRGLAPLSRIYQLGPYGNGSLFAKTLRRIIDDREAGDAARKPPI
jgi:hypothetical protein